MSKTSRTLMPGNPQVVRSAQRALAGLRAATRTAS
jgi:hypothetical protein